MSGLAHAEKPFTLYVHEGVVTSHRSPEPKAGTASETSGLLSKTNALGGPGMAELAVGSSSPVNEVSKLTLRQQLGVLTPHQVQSVLEVKGHHWQTGRKLTRYQTLLTNILDITFKVCQTLNPATLLPVVKSGDLTHQCMRTCSVMSNSLQPHGLKPMGSQASLSIEFYRQEQWSGLPLPSPGDLPYPGIKPRSPELQADFLPSEPPRQLNPH